VGEREMKEMNNNDITDGFDIGDDEKIIEILKKWKGGKLSTSLFTTLSAMLPTPCLETVILRRSDNEVQVLLIPRPENDIIWKGMLHSPGGAVRHSDYLRSDGKPFNGVFERIESGEIKNKFVGEPKLVTSYPMMTKRGPEMVTLFLMKIDDKATLPEGANWYNVEKLNEIPNFIKHQLKAVQEAVKEF
jgi:hypothetical protein